MNNQVIDPAIASLKESRLLTLMIADAVSNQLRRILSMACGIKMMEL